MTELAVLLYDQVVGSLTQDSHGQQRFTYRDGYAGQALSVALPISQRSFSWGKCGPFFEGLLPDNSAVRDSIAARFSVSSRSAFALLSHIGLDCAGAVQLCRPDELDSALGREELLRDIGEAEIGERLATMMVAPDADPLADGEHYSLAGFQPKLALRRTAHGWAEALGAAATTHILKPGIPRLKDESLIEHICMNAAHLLGLEAAQSSYEYFGDTPAIVVTRYDRVLLDGRLTRVHQEDLCQAMRLWPWNKYPGKNCATAAGMVNVVRTHAGMAEAERFFEYLAYNYLIGAPDSHAKNFSLLLFPDGVALAPLYDVASGLPFSQDGKTLRFSKFALPIHHESTFGSITDSHWAALATATQLDPDRSLDRLHDLARRIPDAVSDALASVSDVPETQGVAAQLLPRVSNLCHAALGQHTPATFDIGGSPLSGIPSSAPTFDSVSNADLPTQ
jgi:serine/threonine-protein kinase HipA